MNGRQQRGSDSKRFMTLDAARKEPSTAQLNRLKSQTMSKSIFDINIANGGFQKGPTKLKLRPKKRLQSLNRSSADHSPGLRRSKSRSPSKFKGKRQQLVEKLTNEDIEALFTPKVELTDPNSRVDSRG